MKLQKGEIFINYIIIWKKEKNGDSKFKTSLLEKLTVNKKVKNLEAYRKRKLSELKKKHNCMIEIDITTTNRDEQFEKEIKEVGEYFYKTGATEKAIAEQFGIKIHKVKQYIEYYIYRKRNKLF